MKTTTYCGTRVAVITQQKAETRQATDILFRRKVLSDIAAFGLSDCLYEYEHTYEGLVSLPEFN